MKNSIAKAASANAQQSPARKRSRARLSNPSSQARAKRSTSKSNNPKEGKANHTPQAHAQLVGLVPTGAAFNGGALFSGIGALPLAAEGSKSNEPIAPSGPLNADFDSVAKGVDNAGVHGPLSNETPEWLRQKNKKWVNGEGEPPPVVDAKMIGDLIRTHRLTTETLKSKINEIGIKDENNKDFSPLSLDQVQHFRKGTGKIPPDIAKYVRQLAESLQMLPGAPTQAQLKAQKGFSSLDIRREQRRRGLSDQWMTKDLNDFAPEGGEVSRESYRNMKHGRAKIPPWVAGQIERMSQSPTVPIVEAVGPPSFGIAPVHLERMYRLMGASRFLQWANAERAKDSKVSEKFEALDRKLVSLMIHPGSKRPLDNVLLGRYRIPWWLAKIVQEHYVPGIKEKRQKRIEGEVPAREMPRWRILFEAEKKRRWLTDPEMVDRLNAMRPFHKRALKDGNLQVMKARGITEPWIEEALERMATRPLFSPTGEALKNIDEALAKQKTSPQISLRTIWEEIYGAVGIGWYEGAMVQLYQEGASLMQWRLLVRALEKWGFDEEQLIRWAAGGWAG